MTAPHEPQPTPRASAGLVLLGLHAVLLLACLASAALWFWPEYWAPMPGPASFLLLLPLMLLGGVVWLSPAWLSSGLAGVLALTALVAAGQGRRPFVGAGLGDSLMLTLAWLGCAAALPALAWRLTLRQRQQQQSLQAALQALGQGSAEWQVTREGCRPLFTSADWLQRLGPASATWTRPVDWLIKAHPLDRERVSLSLEAQLAGLGAEVSQEVLRLPTPTGEWAHYQLLSQVLARGPGGRARRLLCTLIDVSPQREAEERQRLSVSLFQHLQEGLLVTDTDFLVLDVNPSFCQMMGQAREDMLGRPMAALDADCLHRSGHSPEQLLAALQERNCWQGRVRSERGHGEPCDWQLTVANIPEPDGPQRYRVITVSDQTQLLHQQALLERQAHTDTLTGLPNQAAFMQILRQALPVAEREGFRLSICRLDLDQFSQINLQHGNELGDALLQQLAQRLQAALRSAQQWSDTVARLNGDEFALLLRSSGPEEAQMALERIQKTLLQPFHLRLRSGQAAKPDGEETVILSVSASIGATLFPQDKSDAETLMRHASHALYRVKHTGRKGYQLFDTAKHLRDEASLLALARVQQALDAGELRLYYQPKIDMRNGQVLGMEALLRWQHPERGLLAPLHFLPLIEPTGLGVQVGDWVIEQALRQCADWLRAGLALEVSVNVTARQLQTPDFALRLHELIQRHKEPVAQHLCLEVLESAALADVRNTDQLMQSCRDFGVRFALDDFGTGYSTLTYLKRLTVNALKIDRSFVQNMLIDEQDSALVEGVIGLARTFDCVVVAEGVETAAHAQALLKLGCVQGQGNGIAPAMPAHEVPAWVERFAQSHWHAPIDP